MAEWPDRDVVLLHKHRHYLPDVPRRVVYDDFIHVVDTLRFLVGNGMTIDVSARVEHGLLHRVLLHIGDGHCQGLGIMDRDSGTTTQEVLEVSGRRRRRRIVEIAEVMHYAGGVEAVTRRDEWTSVSVQRGFDALCTEFLDAVRSGRTLDPADALRRIRSVSGSWRRWRARASLTRAEVWRNACVL